MIEIRLKRKEENQKVKETKDGVTDTFKVVLVGEDVRNGVEWSLTLKYEGENLPSEYLKEIGHSWNDESVLMLQAGSRQSTLEGPG